MLPDLLDDLSGIGPVTVHPFFGGKSLRWDGVQVAIVMGDIVYLRLDDESRAELATHGGEPFRYEARGRQVTVPRYWQLPASVRGDQELLYEWVRRARGARPVTTKGATRRR